MKDKDEKKQTPADIVDEAKKRFERAKRAYGSTRNQAIEDTRFAMGDSDNGWQWPDDIRTARKLDKRVCLTVNMTAQHCNQIINQIRQNRPAVKVSPVDDNADKKTAEILGGLIRNIQVSSAADDAHDLAAEHSIYGGEGFWRIITDYESNDSFNQVIKIVSCPNPLLVYIDPDAREMDKSDAEWGFIFEDIPREQAKREHPEIDPQSWADESKKNGWENMEEGTFRRAEYFYCEHEVVKVCQLDDGSVVKGAEVPDGAVIVKERTADIRKWKWCKLVGGHDAPVDETDWLGDYLPIVSVVGKELNVNGEIVRKGQVRDLKDPARMVNFSYSEAVQTLALQNKVPYMAAAEAIEGYETIWGAANLENRAYLPFNAFTEDGNALPMPARQPPAIMPAAQVQMLQLSTEQMRAASGQQNANFGIKSEASSGIGIQRLKSQGEIATFHFPDNLARALRYEAKVLIDLIQKYYDTERVVRILGLDGQEKTATLQPELGGAYQEQPNEHGEVQEIFNPQVGRYDVVVDTGPSFQTQRQEGAANLNELASRNPQLMQVAGDLIMRAQDFPYADKLADRLAKTIPPELLSDEKNPALQQAQQQIQQMGQQMQQMAGMLENVAKSVEAQELALKAREVEIKEFEAETKRISVVQAGMTPEQIQDIVMGTVHAAMDSGDMVAGSRPEQEPIMEEQQEGGYIDERR